METQTSGSATGTFTFNPAATFDKGADEDQTFQLSHAHVHDSKDPFDPKKREFRVVLSDLPISDEAMDDEYAVTILIQTGKLQALEVVLNAEGKPSSGRLFHQMMSRSLNERSYQFEQKTFDGKTVAGKISMEERNIVTGKPTYRCSATFSAPVQPDPKPTAQGPAAAASGPGKVVAEYLRAMRARDVAALKLICPEADLQRIEGPEGKDYMQSINDWLKQGMQIVRVFEYPEWAKVDLEMAGGSDATSLQTIRVKGSWMIR